MKNYLDGIGYFIAFKMMPDLFDANEEAFVTRSLEEKELFYHNMYNVAYRVTHKMKPDDTFEAFKQNEFKVTNHDLGGNNHILYVEIPHDDKQAFIRCTAFIITYTQFFNKLSNINLFMVEESRMGTTAIGSMSTDGLHKNYGPAMGTQKANVERVKEMVFKK